MRAKRRRTLSTIALLFASSFAHAAKPRETALTLATDLRADGVRTKAQGIPILVLFSLPGCPHCETVRRSHLLAMQREAPPRAIVRQIDVQSSLPIIGFDGVATTHAAFAKVAQITRTPVVSFYAHNGEKLGDGLVGALLPDFYAGYLENALNDATERLRSGGKAKS
jgi:thioredoxin-related protein